MNCWHTLDRVFHAAKAVHCATNSQNLDDYGRMIIKISDYENLCSINANFWKELYDKGSAMKRDYLEKNCNIRFEASDQVYVKENNLLIFFPGLMALNSKCLFN